MPKTANAPNRTRNAATRVQGPVAGLMVTAYTATLQIFQPEVAILHLHWWSHMDLDPNQSRCCAAFRVVVDDYAHHVTIDGVDQHVSPDDEMYRIPVGADVLRQCSAVAQR